MIIDHNLEMAHDQAVTDDVASTNYINQGSEGDAYDSLWYVVRVSGSAADSATDAGTVTIRLQTATDSAFTQNLKDLYISPNFSVAQMTANTELIKVKMPPGALQYIRTYFTVDVEVLTDGTFDAFLVKDVVI